MSTAIGQICACYFLACPKDGDYNQRKTGPVRPMPEVLRKCLSEATESAGPLTNAELDAFLDAHTGGGCGRGNCRHKIDGPISNFDTKVDDGASRYQTLVRVGPWAMSEAMAGCYPARETAGVVAFRVLGELLPSGWPVAIRECAGGVPACDVLGCGAG